MKRKDLLMGALRNEQSVLEFTNHLTGRRKAEKTLDDFCSSLTVSIIENVKERYQQADRKLKEANGHANTFINYAKESANKKQYQKVHDYMKSLIADRVSSRIGTGVALDS